MRLTVQHIRHDTWQSENLQIRDEFGNEARLYLPYDSDGEWIDAAVKGRISYESTAEELSRSAEFLAEVARWASIIDEAVAPEAAVVKEAAAKAEEEHRLRMELREKAVQERCAEVAQYYMQLVRVQRQGYASKGKGELHVNVNDDGHVQPRMWLREEGQTYGGWDFRADQIACFEVKDGSRYRTVEFKPIPEG